jgi:Ca-activated chloride channel family protein
VKKDDAFSTYFSQEMRQKLSLNVTGFFPRYKHFLFMATLLLFIVALARPVKLLPTFDTEENKPALIIVVDVSKSMHKKDVYPTRLTLAMKKLTDFLKQPNSLQIGVILYAKEAYLLYPITQESTLLAQLLNDVNLSQDFAPNSNLFAALQASENLLQSHSTKQILLLGDGGAEVSRKAELDYLKRKHIALSALVTSSKNNQTLNKLCKKSGGISLQHTWSSDDIHALLKHIQHYPTTAEVFHYTLKHYQELYIYPLGLALFFLILLFFPLRRISLLLFFSLLFVPNVTTTLHAGLLDFWYLHQAKGYTQENAYDDAIKSYQKLTPSPKVYYNLATVYYFKKEYMLAISQYKKALSKEKVYNAKIYYNIATAYAQLHKLSHAKEYYTKSLLLYPLETTKENLALVTDALKIERKNLHKAYQKLHFKAIAKSDFVKESVFSNYAVKLEKLIPSEEEQWFRTIENQKFQPYLERLPTTKRSLDANLSF